MFASALYYPQIDIKNETWLKSALLFWDRIHTIVPISIPAPYTTATAQILYGENRLIPLRVDPEIVDKRGLTRRVIDYLRTPAHEHSVRLYRADMPDTWMGERSVHPSDPTEAFFNIHREKLPDSVYELLRRRSSALRGSPDSDRDDYDDPWVRLTADFGAFYMTALATELAEYHGLSIITGDRALEQFGSESMFDEMPARGQRNAMQAQAAGMIAEFYFNDMGIKIKEADVRDILRFRERHAGELGRFRSEITRLVSTIEQCESSEALSEAARTLYLNEVKPAIADLKEALRKNRIECMTSILKITCFSNASTLTTAIPLGLAAPVAVAVGTAFSLGLSGVTYSVKRAETLRNSPYSYLLALK